MGQSDKNPESLMEKYRNLFISGYLNIWHEEFLLGMEASLGKTSHEEEVAWKVWVSSTKVAKR